MVEKNTLSTELVESYRDEQVAINAFKSYRLKQGIVCKRCGSEQHYWLAPKQQFQCRQCRFRTTLRSGTILEGSKLPVSYFFIALHLLIKFGEELSLEQFQHYTGHKYYEPLWDFLRRVKEYMKTKDYDRTLLTFLEVVNLHFIAKTTE